MCTASYERSLGAGELATARGVCARGEWQCGNGACVARGALCDGADDCGDYTDESHCSEYTAPCTRRVRVAGRARRGVTLSLPQTWTSARS